MKIVAEVMRSLALPRMWMLSSHRSGRSQPPEGGEVNRRTSRCV